MPKMNIRNKFLLPTIFLIIVGMGVSTTISYVKSKNALSVALLDNIQQRTLSTAASLTSWIRDRQLDLRSWSNEEVYAKSTKASIIGKAARVSANEKLARLQAEYGYYEDICLAGEDGMVIAANAEKIVGKINVSDREYYQAAMAGDTYVSGVSRSRNSGNPVFFVATPVLDGKQIKGVLFGVVSIAHFSRNFIDSIKVGNSGYAFAMDKTGMLIAHPDRSKILKENLSDHDFGKQMLSQKNGLLTYAQDGIKSKVAFRTIAGQEWVIAVSVPESEILAPVKNLGQINLIVAAAVIAVATVLIFFITSGVVKPINRVVAGLRDAAEGDGDLTKRIAIKSSDEVGELARWFNTFIEKIQHIISEVAQNAQNLTQSSKELAKQMATASGEIKQQIEGIQNSTQNTVTEINNIADIVGQVNDLVSTIAAAVEEQSVTTRDIAGNVAKASEGVGEVNGTIAEGSKAASAIAADIADVTQAADEMTNASSQVDASSKALLELAETLNVMVKQFRV